jgi:pimeloyl-ACP methyl ester carboxylesterase
MTRSDATFSSNGVKCAAWHYPAASDALAGPAGRPCAVLAHGFGCTRDSGLDAFAEALAAAGVDAYVFDYRGFGASDGEPRQVLDIPGQVADYRAAIAAARALDGVDPERIVAWGVSFAGGHVLEVAAADPRLAAVVALTPAPDGLASMRDIARREGPGPLLKATAVGLRDVVAGLRDRPPVLAPLAGQPGTVAALTAPGAADRYTAMAGPSWRNEVAARVFLQVGGYRPVRRAAQVRCPILLQVADLDQTAPPSAAMAAARRAPRAEVRHYPCDHFDVYPGAGWHDAVVAHQVAFLTRHLAAPA